MENVKTYIGFMHEQKENRLKQKNIILCNKAKKVIYHGSLFDFFENGIFSQTKDFLILVKKQSFVCSVLWIDTEKETI